MSAPEIFEPEFTKIADKLFGAEGPVFDKNGQFYMVAPEGVESEPKSSGDVLKVDLDCGKVWNLKVCLVKLDSYKRIKIN